MFMLSNWSVLEIEPQEIFIFYFGAMKLHGSLFQYLHELL